MSKSTNTLNAENTAPLVSSSPTTTIQYQQRRGLHFLIIRIGLIFVAIFLAFYAMSTVYDNRHKNFNTPEQWDSLLEKHPYQYNPATDIRSPCPVVNTWANHGIIPRDGRNVKKQDLQDALTLMGVSPMLSVVFLHFAFIGLNEPSPTASFLEQFHSLDAIDLDSLTKLGVLEHDASLTRNDSSQFPYDTTRPVAEYVHRMVEIAKLHHKAQEGKEVVFTRKDEHDTRKLRWLESFKYNRKYQLPLLGQVESAAECSLLMDVVGRNGIVSVSHMKSFLLNETFPEGWYPRNTLYRLPEILKEQFECWTGVRNSKATLDLLKQIPQ